MVKTNWIRSKESKYTLHQSKLTCDRLNITRVEYRTIPKLGSGMHLPSFFELPRMCVFERGQSLHIPRRTLLQRASIIRTPVSPLRLAASVKPQHFCAASVGKDRGRLEKFLLKGCVYLNKGNCRSSTTSICNLGM
jgi:hypothetical protein